VNDLVVTPVAGMSLSEPLYRALEFSKRKSKTGKAPAGEQRTSAMAEATLQSSYENAGETHAVFRNGISTELRLGADGMLSPGEWTRFAAKAGIRDDLSGDLEILSQTAIVGYNKSRGKKLPASFLVTAGNGFKLETDSANPSGNFAAVQILGTHLEIQAWIKGTKITVGLDLSGDFAQATSLALGEGEIGLNSPEMANADTVVRKTGTYYALGATVAPKVEVSRRDVNIGVKGDWETFAKISILDRYPEQATEPMEIADQRGDLEIYGEWRIPKTSAWIGLDQEWSLQAGQAETSGARQLETVRHSSETKATVRLDF
ncbi:MAG: hypothetical protein AAB425_01450, partial [Bdellovibrionota bacterium]